MGPYCDFCGRRCFLLRRLPTGRELLMATCPKGMAHDRAKTDHDHTTAVNPLEPVKTCAWTTTSQPEPCGEPAAALCYSGSAEHMSDRYFQPLCDRHIEMRASCLMPAAVPLSMPDSTWVVALRELPAGLVTA